MNILRTFFLSFVLLSILHISAPTALAGQVRMFSSDIVVNDDGSADVTETIRYDFGSEERHGIFREIPTTKTNREGQDFRLSLTNVSVTDETGASLRYAETEAGNTVSLRIGDPDVFVSGVRTYHIRYRVSGNVTYFSDHDEFYWNATGNGWDDPISAAAVTVRLPEVVPEGDADFACYTGRFDSTESECTAGYVGGVYTFRSNGVLAPGEGITILAGFPKNLVAVLDPVPMTNYRSSINGTEVPGWVVPSILMTFVLWYIIAPFVPAVLWFLYGRDPKSTVGVATAWFSPPASRKTKRPYPPGICGTILDESTDIRDLTATIVDLARRGYLKIVEKKRNEFELVRHPDMKPTPDDPGLLPYERLLLRSVFGGIDLSSVKSTGTTTVTVNGKTVYSGSSKAADLTKLGISLPDLAFGTVAVKDVDISSAIDGITGSMYTYCVDEGIFPKNPDTVRKSHSFIQFLAIMTANIPLLVTFTAFRKAMPRKTIYGTETGNVIKSLKQFLVSQDKQLAFMADKQLMFEKLLPYAVAFGVEKIWSKRIADMGIETPDWYEGADDIGFTRMPSFSQNMTRSFAPAAAVSTYYTPTTTRSSRGFSSGFSSHSSGSRSGGFSGGGGGGGGRGGSW